jgi:hypothetical protein
VLAADRRELIERAFFFSSAPLRTEADNWFLRELHGRYDVILEHVSRHSGCSHGDLVQHVRDVSPETGEQVGGYLKVLGERYRLIERRSPIFAKPSSKQGRYYLTDNFLRSWLAALASPVSALNFAPVAKLVAQADARLADLEGGALEKLAGLLYEERSRKNIGDFALTERIQGYWDRGDTEIDLVAIDESERRIRFGSCKRNPARLVEDIPVLDGHVARFLAHLPRFADWRVEKVGIAPVVPPPIRTRLQAAGHLVQDLVDLTDGLRP